MSKKGLLAKYNQLPVAVRATLWSMICGVLQKAVSLITTPIFTRLLSTAQYGQYTTYNSWLNIFTMVCSFNLSSAVYNKGLTKYGSDRDGYMSSMLGTTTFITLAVMLLYLPLRNIINGVTELTTPIQLLMFVEILFYQSFSFWTVRQRYDFRYRSVVAATLLNVLLNAVIGIVVVSLTEDKGISRIISCALVNLAVGIVIYIHVFAKGKKFFTFDYAKFALLFNIPLIPHFLSTYILDQADRIMIQKMCGYDFVGIYGVAYSIGLVMKIVTNSFNQSMAPWVYQKLDEKDYDSIKKKTTPIMLFVATVLIAFAAVVPEAMKVLAAESYQEAIYIIPSVAASTFFTLMYTWFSNVEFYYDANKFTMVMSCAGALANIVLNYIFIKQMEE